LFSNLPPHLDEGWKENAEARKYSQRVFMAAHLNYLSPNFLSNSAWFKHYQTLPP
jgi:hypothetical protein